MAESAAPTKNTCCAKSVAAAESLAVRVTSATVRPAPSVAGAESAAVRFDTPGALTRPWLVTAWRGKLRPNRGNGTLLRSCSAGYGRRGGREGQVAPGLRRFPRVGSSPDAQRAFMRSRTLSRYIVTVSVHVTASPFADTVAADEITVVNSGIPEVNASKMPIESSVTAPDPV